MTDNKDTRYKEDKADPQVNIDKLNSIFDIDMNLNGNIENQLESIKNMRKELLNIQEDVPDADQIIHDNIKRANAILDIIETDIKKGDRSARLIEVYTQLINAITNAATSITGISYNQQMIEYKNRSLDIKEKELMVKSAIKGADNVNITTNNLVMNREELLKMLEDNSQ